MKIRSIWFALFIAVWCGTLLAQGYPSKPVKIVVPYAAGGYYDVVARIVGHALSDSLGQPMVVENKIGANGIVGTEFTAKAPPDGYTIMVGGIGPHSINVSLYSKLPYDPVRDFVPIIFVADQPLIVVVHPKVEANSLKDLIALARLRPDQISYSSPGAGSTPHLAAVMLSSIEGIKLNHVPFKGSAPAVTAVMGGVTDLLFGTASDVLQQIKAGKLRALAGTGTVRIPALPNLPTVAELGVPNYEATAWFAFFAPAGTPSEIVTKLNAEIGKVLSTPHAREKLSAQGTAQIIGGTPKRLADQVKSEIAKWAKIVKESGAKVE
jgi:tripartite-type tricarboxylate transporter receptor subunit TctC